MIDFLRTQWTIECDVKAKQSLSWANLIKPFPLQKRAIETEKSAARKESIDTAERASGASSR
jgi:hypothetical protein